MKKIFFYLITAIACSSCASLDVKKMTVNDPAFVFEPTNKKVKVLTYKSFKSNVIDLKKFNGALKSSVSNSKIFITDTTNADYKIRATLVHWMQPPVSLNFHTDLRVEYKIVKGEELIFEKTIETNGLATMGDAIVGSKRSLMSFERAIKKNIEEFLKAISQAEVFKAK